MTKQWTKKRGEKIRIFVCDEKLQIFRGNFDIFDQSKERMEQSEAAEAIGLWRNIYERESSSRGATNSFQT